MTEVKYSLLLSVALPEHDRAKLVDLYQTLLQRDNEIERLREALEDQVQNPSSSAAREALTGRKGEDQ